MNLCARITPCDSLFLPDGRPFNQDDEGLAAAESVFPPMPNLLAACIRSTIASVLGAATPTLRKWHADQAVNLPAARGATFRQVVGDGSDWGGLRIRRVWIVGSDERRYLAAPLTITNAHEAASRLTYTRVSAPERPAESGFSTDLGDDLGCFQALQGHDGYAYHLLGETDFAKLTTSPAAPLADGSMLDTGKLFPTETYVGLALSAQKMQAPGRLYAAGHLRAWVDRDDGPSAFEVEFALENEASVVGEALVAASAHGGAPLAGMLGGRGRAVEIRFREPRARPKTLDDACVAPLSGNLLIYALAPLIVDGGQTAALRRGESFLGCKGVRLTSVVMNRAQRFSAWDLDSRGRSAWVWVVPAGAVFACTLDDEDAEQPLRKRLSECGLNLLPDVDAQRYRIMGFGDCAIGVPPSRDDGRGTT